MHLTEQNFAKNSCRKFSVTELLQEVTFFINIRSPEYSAHIPDDPVIFYADEGACTGRRILESGFSCAEKEIGEGKNGKELTGDKEWYIIWT